MRSPLLVSAARVVLVASDWTESLGDGVLVGAFGLIDSSLVASSAPIGDGDGDGMGGLGLPLGPKLLCLTGSSLIAGISSSSSGSIMMPE